MFLTRSTQAKVYSFWILSPQCRQFYSVVSTIVSNINIVCYITDQMCLLNKVTGVNVSMCGNNQTVWGEIFMFLLIWLCVPLTISDTYIFDISVWILTILESEYKDGMFACNSSGVSSGYIQFLHVCFRWSSATGSRRLASATKIRSLWSLSHICRASSLKPNLCSCWETGVRPSTPWYHAGYAVFLSLICRLQAHKLPHRLMLPNHLTNWPWCHIVTKWIFPPVLTLSWFVSCVYIIPSLTGDHLRLRPEQLQGLSDQVEQRGGDHVQPVPGGRGDQMFARPLRAARPPHRGGNEEVASFPRAAVGPISVAPWRADRKSWWRVSVQVSIWSECKCVQRAYLYAPVISTHAVGFTCMCWGFQASLKFFKCVFTFTFTQLYSLLLW